MEGKLLNNFRIQTFKHFFFGILEKNWFESGYMKLFCARARTRTMSRRAHTTSAPLYPERARTSRHRKTQWSEAGAVATVHLRLMTRASGLGWCHAACAHSPAGELPSTIGHRLRRTSSLPPRPCWCSCRPWRLGETASTHHRAYKNTPCLFPRVPEQHRHLPPTAISATGDFAAPLAPVTNRLLQAPP
jgi:hypothetical protein